MDRKKCIDVAGGDTTNGKGLQLWDCVASPGPSPSHYNDPGKGCLSDEDYVDAKAQAWATSGDLCMPSCNTSSPCPEDKPAGATAAPKCVSSELGQAPDSCILACLPPSDPEPGPSSMHATATGTAPASESKYRGGEAADLQCGLSASCKKTATTGIKGICTYGD
jgi:hypothetical protein